MTNADTKNACNIVPSSIAILFLYWRLNEKPIKMKISPKNKPKMKYIILMTFSLNRTTSFNSGLNSQNLNNSGFLMYF